MQDPLSTRKATFGTTLLFCWMTLCLASTVWLSVHTLKNIQREQAEHAGTFVQAKRVAATFDAEILNARIFFIYYVTIQKPNSLEGGWDSYHHAETAVRDLSLLVDRDNSLADLRSPTAKLQADLESYSATLAQVLHMVQRGEHKGPHYDEMVKVWAAKGAVLVGDATTLDSLCFKSSQANSTKIFGALHHGQDQVEVMLGISVLLSLALTLLLNLRVRQLLQSESKSSMKAHLAPVTGDLGTA